MLAAPEDPLRLSPLLQASAGEVLEAVRKLGLEGVVGKRLDSIYEPGERSGAWRCVVRGRLREPRARLCGESEEWVSAANPRRGLPGSQGPANCPVPVQKSA
jgi:hypothetical protein